MEAHILPIKLSINFEVIKHNAVDRIVTISSQRKQREKEQLSIFYYYFCSIDCIFCREVRLEPRVVLITI